MLGEVQENATIFCGPFGNESMTQSFSRWQDMEQEESKGFADFLEFLLSATVILPLIFILMCVTSRAYTMCVTSRAYTVYTDGTCVL